MSSVHADAGTDCALGEIFSLDLPPGIDTVSIEVIAKHNLTGGLQLQTTARTANITTMHYTN
jgi:hypothetical protein